MPAEFDPLLFFEIAKELAESSDDEAALRVAVGRAYYSTFLIAREAMGCTEHKNDVHYTTRYRVSRKKYALSTKLLQLLELRKAADYDLSVVDENLQDWKVNWEKARALAEKLIPEFAAWRDDPQTAVWLQQQHFPTGAS